MVIHMSFKLYGKTKKDKDKKDKRKKGQEDPKEKKPDQNLIAFKPNLSKCSLFI